MRWKLILLGGLAFYVAMFLLTFATNPLIHEGYLKPFYQAHAALWRPELNQVPPDMGALMPRWIGTGLLGAFIQVAIFGWIQKSLEGPGWKQGLKFGAILGLFGATWCAAYSGIFNATDRIWIVWSLEGFIYYLPGGALVGWMAERFNW